MKRNIVMKKYSTLIIGLVMAVSSQVLYAD